MKKIFGLFRKRWLLSLLGTLALAILVWFLGPLFGFAGREPLADESARWIAIGVLLAGWGLYQLGSYLSARRRNRQMLDHLAGAPAPPPDAATAASADELQTLRERFDEALSVLKKTDVKHRLGGQYLYQLPWYIIIGPPGCGKTTALVNSDLHFPLAERFGQDAIRGVGGTRNCDWWFTDQAVLLDTAGRYTTQDSYEAVDSAAWTGFLGLLKKYRPRRPINGALVAISLADLMQQTETERAIHARAIRQRVQELHQVLGIRFPIYVLFTKSDLIAGFMEFFNDLGKEERAQVWGTTFPMDEANSPAGVIEGFAGEFDGLTQRINERQLERLQQERDPAKRSLILAFPQQFSSLKETADRFLQAVFQPSRFEERPLVRGVYFTSGTQVGTPIDRVMNTLAMTFGLDRQAMAMFSASGRSYFINRLFREVVFREAGLAGTNLRLERRRQWVQRGAYAAAIGISLLAAIAWFTSYTRNQTYVDEVRQQSEAIEAQIASLPAAHRDPVDILPLLNAVRTVPGGYADRDRGIPWLMGLGLYQGDKLGLEAGAAYQRVLKKALLPRILLRLEDQMRQGAGEPDYLFEALRVYLMLDDPNHYDPDAVYTWVTLDWDQNLPREVSIEQREQLEAHLDALLEEQPRPLPIALDADLIKQARNILLRMPLAERVYARLKQEGVSKDIADFKISEAAGRDAAFVFVRRSGNPLTRGIPALYTYDGYHQGFARESLLLIGGLAQESWILGTQDQFALGSGGVRELTEEVRERYLRDYAIQWEQLLRDIDIAPLRDLEHAVQVLRVLSDTEHSPLRKLLEAASRQTTLDQAPAQERGLAEKATKKLGKFRNRVEKFFRETESRPTPIEETPESYVTRKFAKLHALVAAKGDQPPPLDRTLESLNQLYIYLRSVESAADSGQKALEAVKGEGAQIKAMKNAASDLPLPVNDWLGTLAQDSANITFGGARAHLNNIWTSDVLPFCRDAINDRYPLRPNSLREATLHDFGRLFGPGGLMDSFFQENLRSIVDTSRRQWRWLGGGLGIPASVLAQFQRAATIKEAFFLGGGQTPSVSFELKPLSMDTQVSQFILDLEGQIVGYRHGPPRISKVQWPGPQGTRQVRVVFVDALGNRRSVAEEGPWAWFRMLDRARVEPSSQPELFQIGFQQAGMEARWEMRAISVLNPFRLRALNLFRCPERL